MAAAFNRFNNVRMVLVVRMVYPEGKRHKKVVNGDQRVLMAVKSGDTETTLCLFSRSSPDYTTAGGVRPKPARFEQRDVWWRETDLALTRLRFLY